MNTLRRIAQNEQIRRTAARNAKTEFDPKEDELRLMAETLKSDPPLSEEIDALCTTKPD